MIRFEFYGFFFLVPKKLNKKKRKMPNILGNKGSENDLKNVMNVKSKNQTKA